MYMMRFYISLQFFSLNYFSEKFKNLDAYVDRMIAEFWSDWDELVPKQQAKKECKKEAGEKIEEKAEETAEGEAEIRSEEKTKGKSEANTATVNGTIESAE